MSVGPIVETIGRKVMVIASMTDRPAFVPYAWIKADTVRAMEVKKPLDANCAKSGLSAKLPRKSLDEELGG
jgi:hypothetical protein